ncbi:response regulator transcription factor [Marinifilum caeruleilacunae]|uniref:Response regulator transcription factor n=1 Tax=Marinifilum caeruleilacunae TaxID=2499076 RepID=A0ABX1X1L1_9BACT|nr:response regulator transcription factor [Marinifilum caeruleilacunae]NOU61973.1 response regulator transcription factor [Marinifilum caeruleilacunae]
MEKVKVLYVEDEPNLGQIVYDSLLLKGFDIVWETDGAQVMSKFHDFAPDICVLDIMLPNVDGYQLCEHIRSKFPNLPIIFLTAKTETHDLVKGFEAGGTDYIRKPFSIEELVIRIENQLKIHGSNQNANTSNESKNELDEIKLGTYTYFPKRYELITPSKTINLSNREGELLKKLTEMGSKVVERKDILMQVWGDDSFFNSRNLDVYIKKLRNYFGEDENIEIQTLRGRGYLFLVK